MYRDYTGVYKEYVTVCGHRGCIKDGSTSLALPQPNAALLNTGEIAVCVYFYPFCVTWML